MPLFTLLLEATPHVDFMATLKVVGIVMLWIIASASSLEKIWLWFTGGARKKDEAINNRFEEVESAIGQFVDKEALEKRFISIEGKQTMQGAEVVNQHNTLMEYERKRAELTGEFRSSIAQLQKDGRALEPLPGQVADLKAKFEALTAQISDIKSGQRELKQELRDDMKNNKGEILEAIKALKQ